MVPPVGVDLVFVRNIDHTTQIDVVAEVGAVHYLTPVSLDLIQVRSIDSTIAVHVCFEKTKRDICRPAAAIDVGDLNCHVLHVSNASERNPHFGAAEGGCAGRGRAADNSGIARGNCRIEGKDSQETASGIAVFHPGRAGKRHVNVEGAGRAMCQP